MLSSRFTLPACLQAAKKGDKAKGGPVPQLQLLHSITGSFRPGVLTALMGVSGAKPSLALATACMGSRRIRFAQCDSYVFML
jgi:hypothetical protein